MTVDPSASTRLVALLGDPVRHSLSPIFQNAAIAALGLDAVYLALPCREDDVPGLIRGIARAGGAGNITVPHKEVAARTVEELTEAARRTGACNTFWEEKGVIWGDNTDVAGFSAATRALLGRSLTGGRVLLLGAGGAARAVVQTLVSDRAAEIVVLNRTRGRAEELATRFDDSPTRIIAVGSVGDLVHEAFDLVVNSTSLGLRSEDPFPIRVDGSIAMSAAIDLVYRPERTRWIRTLRAGGIPAEDGLEMLLQQGAAAFTRWWRIDAPIDAMRDALPPR